MKNDEEDLGGWIMFRSGIELEYSLNNDWKISIGYDHRSSGDIWEYNPGMETVENKYYKKLSYNAQYDNYTIKQLIV